MNEAKLKKYQSKLRLWRVLHPHISICQDDGICDICHYSPAEKVKECENAKKLSVRLKDGIVKEYTCQQRPPGWECVEFIRKA